MPQYSSKVTTSSLVEEFIQAKRDARRSLCTLQAYSRILGQLAREFLFVPLEPSALERFLSSKGTSSDENLSSLHRRVNTFYRWLIRRGLLAGDHNPFDRMDRPKVRRKVPRFLTLEQMRLAVEASKPGHERALILVFMDAGPRVGDLLGLSKANIIGNALHLASGKTGERLVPITPEVRGLLESLPTHYLFPKKARFGRPQGIPYVDEPASVWSLRARVTRVLRRAGITGPKLGPHLLRHSFATAFMNNGGDVITLRSILGHTTTRMTERYVQMAMGALQRKHLTATPIRAMMSPIAAVPEAKLPTVKLPPEADLPLTCDDGPVFLVFVADRRRNMSGQRTFYYLRARSGERRWPVASLGTDLPLNVVDAYRLAVHGENQRRLTVLGISREVTG